MSFLSMLRWWWLEFLYVHLLLHYVRTDWPSFNSSKVQLLGLFPDAVNTSKPTTLSFHSRAMFKAAIILAQQYNITIDGQPIGYQSVQSDGNGINALANTCLMVSSSNVVGIVGPAFSRESRFIAPFAAKIGIPVISYASTDPTLSDRNSYPAFYRTVPSDYVAALAIAKLFLKFNWTSCIIVYQNDAFGSGGANAISEIFNDNKMTVMDMIIFDIVTLSIQGDLKALLTKSATRLVILWAVSTYTSVVLQNALSADVLGPHYVWILSSNAVVNNFNGRFYDKLSGILTIEPVVGNVVNAPINSTLLNAAYRIWQQYEPETFPGADNVDDYALFAFDATWILIQSLKKFCSMTDDSNRSSCMKLVDSSICFDRHLINSSLFHDTITSINYLGVSGSLQFMKNITDRIDGIYYVSKNIQLLSNGLNAVPVLVWSYADDWTLYSPTSVIVWPGHSLITPSGLASLSGVNLRIVVTETAPFTMVTQATDSSGQTKPKLIGYMPDLIELLRMKMGFIPNITLAVNQSFNQIIGSVANDAYDMFVAQTTITATRRQKVAFSNSIFDNSLRIIIRRESNADIDLFSYLSPFSVPLWLALLGACIYAAILICLLERHENSALQNRSLGSLIGMSMWFSLGTIVGYGVDYHVMTAAGRLLTVGLYILSLVLVAAYTANLASDLTLAKSKDIISGIDDIKNGKLSFSRIGVLLGSSLEDYYLREISGGNKNYYPIKDKQEIYDGLLNKIIDAAIMDAGVLEYITSNIYCNLTLIGKDFEKSAFGIVFQKNWQYEQLVDVNILALRESGALDNLKRKWFQATHCALLPDVSQAMTVQSMAGLFFTFGMISVVAILLYVWQKKWVIKKFVLNLMHRKNLISKRDFSSEKHTNAPTAKSTTLEKSYL